MEKLRVTVALVISIAVLSNQGCSFMFVKGPPKEPMAQKSYFQCSEGNGWPIFDTVWAALNGIGALSAAGSSEEENPDRGQIIAVGAAWLVLSGASAIYGFGRTSACRKAKQKQMNTQLSGGTDSEWFPAPVQPVSSGESSVQRAPSPQATDTSLRMRGR